MPNALSIVYTRCNTSLLKQPYWIPLPALIVLCIQHSSAAPFWENYAKFYFDAKHLEKRLNKGVVKFLVPFFSKKNAYFGQYWKLPKFSRWDSAHHKSNFTITYISYISSYTYQIYKYVYHIYHIPQNVEFLLNYTFGSMFGIPYQHFRQTFCESISSLTEKQCWFLKQTWLAASTNFSLSTCFL